MELLKTVGRWIRRCFTLPHSRGGRRLLALVIGILLIGAASLIGSRALTAMTAIGALVVIYLTDRRIEIAQDAQFTDRYNRAVEQLAHDRATVRLGGVYSLGQLAKDCRPLFWPVMQVLASHLREHCDRLRWDGEEIDFEVEHPDDPLPPNKCDDETQAVLNIVGSRASIEDQSAKLDLSCLDLRGGALIGVFDKVNLAGCDLRRVDLGKADLRGCDLWHAYLTTPQLERARYDATTGLSPGVDPNWRPARFTEEE